MDIIEIDKFLTKEICNYCINFFENNSNHWQHFNKRQKIQLQNLLNKNLEINRLYIKYMKLYPNHKLKNIEIIKWPAGEYHDWHDDKIYYNKTTITYLNEDYEGGRTTVENYTVEPKIGKIIFFDADKKHRVSMVTRGPRYVMLAWYTKK
tara:strand:+ start:61 stop:510 length:450 start_codon:yes stop_codon:yes gene_type:complete